MLSWFPRLLDILDKSIQRKFHFFTIYLNEDNIQVTFPIKKPRDTQAKWTAVSAPTALSFSPWVTVSWFEWEMYPVVLSIWAFVFLSWWFYLGRFRNRSLEVNFVNKKLPLYPVCSLLPAYHWGCELCFLLEPPCSVLPCPPWVAGFDPFCKLK